MENTKDELKSNPASRLGNIIPKTLGICLLLLILFLFSFSVWFDKTSQSCYIDEGSIGNIRSEASEIKNNMSNYSVSSRDFLDKSTEGGHQDTYSLGNQIVLINQTFFGEMGKTEISYFLRKDKIFYFTEKETRYILPIYEDSSASVKNVQMKEFFIGRKQELCAWYENYKLQQNDQGIQNQVNNLISDLKDN